MSQRSKYHELVEFHIFLQHRVIQRSRTAGNNQYFRVPSVESSKLYRILEVSTPPKHPTSSKSLFVEGRFRPRRWLLTMKLSRK